MTSPHAQFGIDEIYFHAGLDFDLLKKLQQRSDLCLDAENSIIQKHVTHDMILIFYKRIPSQSQLYRFVEFLDRKADKQSFIAENTLLNEEELFAAIKAKTFALITPRTLAENIIPQKDFRI